MPAKRTRPSTALGASGAKKQARPRVPLPRQTGGAHEDKTKRPWRRRKHKVKDFE